ncbi:MAG TPA: YibE/F family protein, partial [Anaerolineae bacterium]|nr:YibE/F family protein [Anaerolineae bacterium]
MHQHDHPSQRPPITLAILAAVMLIALGVIGRSNAPSIQAQANPNEETVEARVIAVLDESMIDQGGIQQPYQRLRLEILSGSRAGRAVEVDYGTQGFVSSSVIYRPDDRVQVSQIIRPDGGEIYFITEPDRLGALIALLLLFVVVILAVSRWKGLRSLLGMAISFYVITQFVLPLILAGRDPVLVTIIGAFGLLAVTQYLIYGWSLKTHAAVLGILI